MANAGWFPQPDGQDRYYDGEQWTDNYRPSQQMSQPPAQVQKKSSPWKWILITLVVLFLVCGGGFAACTAGVLGTANEVGESIESEDAQPGGPDNPLEISEGEAFEVSGFAYAEGWSISEGPMGDMVINDLKVTNNRDTKDSAIVEIKLLKGSEILATADCTSDQLQPGQTATLDCMSADEVPADYDTITINDTF